ncbi:MAG: c-type cytochrome [Sandaracinaceae bacterium]
MRNVMTSTFSDRMGGRATTQQVAQLGAWLDALPAPSGEVLDERAVERGRGLFERTAGCATCHAGDRLTDDRNADVGTGGAFQVPALRAVALRAPYFHDGCAPTLESVLDGACDTEGRHGHAGALTSAQRADLLAYLRSL